MDTWLTSPSTVLPTRKSKTVIFDAANATSETMKRRGRKKAE